MARINSIASKEGDIYVMGGSTLKGDVWRIQRREGIFECFELETISEGPSPRCNYACLLVGNAFIVFGGCVLAGNDPVDTTLYLLNTRGPPYINRKYSMRAFDSNCIFFLFH